MGNPWHIFHKTPGSVQHGKRLLVFQDLWCSSCAAKEMVEDQGIDTLDELNFLKDGDAEK